MNTQKPAIPHPEALGIRLRRRSLAALGVGLAAGAAGFAAPGPRPSAGPFDLAAPALRYVRSVRAHEVTVMQSFAVDRRNRHVYVAQIRRDRQGSGDLAISQLDLSGRLRGRMDLRGFGHGVGLGAEPEDGRVWLWTEAEADPDSGFGRAVTRFRFRDGRLLENADGLDLWRVEPESTSNSPALDLEHRRIAVRRRSRGKVYYGIYDLDEFKAGRIRPLTRFAQTGVTADEVFQGFALYGDYLYQVTGEPYDSEHNPPSGGGNCRLSCVDVRTGKLRRRVRTHAARTLGYREPEGVEIVGGPRPRMFLGFASGRPDDRTVSLYYLSRRGRPS